MGLVSLSHLCPPRHRRNPTSSHSREVSNLLPQALTLPRNLGPPPVSLVDSLDGSAHSKSTVQYVMGLFGVRCSVLLWSKITANAFQGEWHAFLLVNLPQYGHTYNTE